MDPLTHYRTLVQELLTTYATLATQRPTADVETMLAFDESRDQYLWLQVGWAGQHRVQGITVHVRLHDGKIWIEQDWTEEGIATDLVKAGVPKDDIVLAFHPPEVRPLTEFAAA